MADIEKTKKVLMDGKEYALPEIAANKIIFLREQLADAQTELAHLREWMPCKHPYRYQAFEIDGTPYCAICELEQARKESE